MNKYRNIHTVYNGSRYDSKKEAHRAWELDMLKKGKVVRAWQPQVPFLIQHKGIKICKYIADFQVVYMDGLVEYEDVKGVRTDVYKLKKKLVQAFYGITIKEV